MITADNFQKMRIRWRNETNRDKMREAENRILAMGRSNHLLLEGLISPADRFTMVLAMFWSKSMVSFESDARDAKSELNNNYLYR